MSVHPTDHSLISHLYLPRPVDSTPRENGSSDYHGSTNVIETLVSSLNNKFIKPEEQEKVVYKTVKGFLDRAPRDDNTISALKFIHTQVKTHITSPEQIKIFDKFFSLAIDEHAAQVRQELQQQRLLLPTT